MRFRQHLALAAVAALGSGVASASAAQVPETPRQADAQLSRAMRDLVAMPGGPPGAISIVNRDGRVKALEWGRANVGVPRRPGSRMYMRIASTSKAFTAATALSLVGERRMSLNQTIGELRPDLPAAWHEATLAQVLQHTAGLPDFTAAPGFVPALLEDLSNPPAPLGLLAFVASDPLDFTPGSDFEYSNTGPIVVGLIVEAVTGRSYAEALAEQVAEPLELLRTGLPAGTSLPTPTIGGYEVADGRPENVTTFASWGGWAWASGGLISSPGNLSTFARGYAGGGLFGGPTRLRQYALVPGASEPKGPGTNAAGLGIFRYTTRCGVLYGHTGNIVGYTQLFAATRDGRRSVTFSVNTQVDGRLLQPLRKAQAAAVCAALA